MSGEFAEVTRYLDKLDDAVTSPAGVRRMRDAGTKAATSAARSVAARRRLHNWHGSRLDAREGNDGAELTGPWRLFEQGRRSSGEITPRSAGAVSTPDGPRFSSSYGPSVGLGVYQDASDLAGRTVPPAVHDQFLDEVARGR